ncbi:hypothetical protein KR009_011511 [Drosophila setifemur]|nr:hypothetical protein KR009_011511 [Drosophila setifemur]
MEGQGDELEEIEREEAAVYAELLNFPMIRAMVDVLLHSEYIIDRVRRNQLKRPFKAMTEMLFHLVERRNEREEILVRKMSVRPRGAKVLLRIVVQFARGSQSFRPLALRALSYCLEALKDNNEAACRASVYTLLPSLGPVLGLDLSILMPEIIGHAFRDAFDSNSFDEPMIVINHLKVSVLDMLKQFAQSMDRFFQPFLQKSLFVASELVLHPEPAVRISALVSMATFMTVSPQFGCVDEIKPTCLLFVTRSADIMRTEKEMGVVEMVVNCLCTAFQIFRRDALATRQVADDIFECIKDLITGKMQCRTTNDEASEDQDSEDIVEIIDWDEDEPMEGKRNVANQTTSCISDLRFTAIDLMFAFSVSTNAELYAHYFEQVHPLFSQLLETKPDSDQNIYRLIGNCMVALVDIAPFFDILYPIFIRGLSESLPSHRQYAAYSLGELIFLAGDQAVEVYPEILRHLCNSTEEDTEARDSIGVLLARLIVTNYQAVPLPKVMPILLAHLPITHNFKDNEIVLNALHLIFHHSPQIADEFIEQILKITIHMLSMNQVRGASSKEQGNKFVLEMRQLYPEIYEVESQSTPEAITYLHSLFYLSW